MKVNPLDFVLVVDDSSSMVKIISGIVNKLGYKNIDTAYSGADALKKAQQTSYKLILSDWNMENMSGIEFLRHIRALKGAPTNHDVPFVLITAEAKPENVVAAKQSGVSGYIVKPFSADKLNETIQRL
jgi:two-component system chemotaxis response regulator CheY